MRFVLEIVAAVACFAVGPDPIAPIRGEIARVNQSSSDARARDTLKAATAALDVGRTWLALERLGQATELAHWAFVTGATGRAFGDITAAPTMFLSGADGKTARVIYGAAPDLHEQVGKASEGLLR